jgi:hypothetical protein
MPSRRSASPLDENEMHNGGLLGRTADTEVLAGKRGV